MADELKVTQADRERANECFDLIDLEEQADAIARVAPIFARHRIATETRVQATIEALRGAGDQLEADEGTFRQILDGELSPEEEGGKEELKAAIENCQANIAAIDRILSRHKGEGR